MTHTRSEAGSPDDAGPYLLNAADMPLASSGLYSFQAPDASPLPQRGGPRGGVILVTGANGFVGSHLVEALLARGYRVRCMVRSTSDLRFIKHLPVEWAYADVRDDSAALRQACEGVDAVCYLAALTRALDRETMMRVNAAGPEALARACLDANSALRRFLFVSSQAAAGPADGPADAVNESRPPRPITWYGQSKLAAERALSALCLQSDGRFPLTIVRPAAVMGPRDRDFLAYFQLVRLRLGVQLGRGDRRVTFIHVRDLVDILVRALESDMAAGQTYFAGTFDATYPEMSRAIAREMGRDIVNVAIPVGLVAAFMPLAALQGRLTGRPPLLSRQRLLEMSQRYWLCSSARARRDLGFEPHYDLQALVHDTVRWYLQEGWLG